MEEKPDEQHQPLSEPMYHRVPPGFSKLQEGIGWILYSQPNSPPQGTDYVVVTDLNITTLRSLWGEVRDPRPVKGPYGGPDPLIKRQGLGDFISQAPRGTIALFTGGFFNPSNDPTQIAFGVKDNGEITTDGADLALVKKAMLITFGINAMIRPFDLPFFQGFDLWQANIFVGLDPAEPKSPTAIVGRTFLGTEVKNPDGSIDRHTLFVFSSSGATQAHANEMLRDFGAEHRIMFDGGGSAKSSVKGTTCVETGPRLIPHMLALLPR